MEMATQITGDSAEAVAYALLEQIAQAEDWCTGGFGVGTIKWNKTRKEILDAYAECRNAATGSRRVSPPP